LRADKEINDKKLRKLQEEEVFIQDKLRHLKKEIIDIRHFLKDNY